MFFITFNGKNGVKTKKWLDVKDYEKITPLPGSKSGEGVNLWK